MYVYLSGAQRNEVRCSNLAPGNTPAGVCEQIYKKVFAGAEATFAFAFSLACVCLCVKGNELNACCVDQKVKVHWLLFYLMAAGFFSTA
jgi:hypothetical protein